MMSSDPETAQEDKNYEPDDNDDEPNSYPAPHELRSSPNDFNIQTITSFIESKNFIIPGFQRNFVWDIRRASRLIESIIIGLPIPQIFLYERDQNKFLVIDGQQRLMSIFYFKKGRFPKIKKQGELRQRYDQKQSMDNLPINDNEYFVDFKLNLPELTGSNKYHKLSYEELDENSKTSFDMRPIRNVIISPMQRGKDENAMYAVFSRLNTGGMNLNNQELRRCVYESKFYDMLYELNLDKKWRKFVGAEFPDVHMHDVEILLRGVAMLIEHDSYKPSLIKFLNTFSYNAKKMDEEKQNQLKGLLNSFFNSNNHLPKDAFQGRTGRFSPTIFEAVFVTACEKAYSQGRTDTMRIKTKLLTKLKDDPDFQNAAHKKTTDKQNVNTRLERAHEILVNGNEQ